MPISVTELQAREAAITMWGAIVLLSFLTVCATVLLVLALRRYSRDQEQEHAERMASIQASKDLGQTAWAHSDVHKTQLIREQAKRIRELEQWKADTEARLASIDLRTYATKRR